MTRLLPNHSGLFRSFLIHPAYFLIVTAIGELGTGLALLVLPSVPLTLLFGVVEIAPVGALVARLAGAALLAIGVASWLTKGERQHSAQRGLLVGLLIYDVAAGLLLGYAGLVLSLVGIALWPAVVLHVALAIWCGLCLMATPHHVPARFPHDPEQKP